MSALTRMLLVCLLPLALVACTNALSARSPPATSSPAPTTQPARPTEILPATSPSPPATAQPTPPSADGQALASGDCPLTEPAWVTPPEDSAVNDKPVASYYFVNKDSSMLASAWWVHQPEYPLRAGEEGNKVGWFRPAGATLTITGERLDGKAEPLESHVPCCYPTRFQATGLMFPTEGCWRVTATAEDRELSFVVRVESSQEGVS
jgi:hypothetical protein